MAKKKKVEEPIVEQAPIETTLEGFKQVDKQEYDEFVAIQSQDKRLTVGVNELTVPNQIEVNHFSDKHDKNWPDTVLAYKVLDTEHVDGEGTYFIRND